MSAEDQVKFYQLSIPERLNFLMRKKLLNAEQKRNLAQGKYILELQHADKMIENVVAVMGLPVGLAQNFIVNNKKYVIPLVVEEPSIVAALSAASKIAASAGGFKAHAMPPILIGQIHVVKIKNIEYSKQQILAHKKELLDLANSFHHKMVVRGGGAVDLDIRTHASEIYGNMLVVHLLVNTCDAMGANCVNTMCEGVAPRIAELCQGKVCLRIMSNLCDRALVRVEVSLPTQLLHMNNYAGEAVRDGIILATEIAKIDPYRAATHNKGIMNGIDAVALATGNDWRAVEAAAHAYASRSGQYTSLTSWSENTVGDLMGVIEMPIKVGIVGGASKSNPMVAMNLQILQVESATELAMVMGAVGLAQNFAALRALVTTGIQQGHMALHARNVAMSAGAPGEIFDIVVKKLIESNEIKIWKAIEIIEILQEKKQIPSDS